MFDIKNSHENQNDNPEFTTRLVGNILYRLASPADNEQLTELAALTSMSGKIGFRTERAPDFFALHIAKGEGISIVAELNGKIIACASSVEMPVYIRGKITKANYLCDFKVHPDYRKKGITATMIQCMLTELKSKNADILFSLIVGGNKAIGGFLKGSQYWSAATPAGSFRVFQLIPRRIKFKHADYIFEEKAADRKIFELLQAGMKKYKLAPVITESSLKHNRILIAWQQNEIVAVVSLADTSALKQDILTALPFRLRILTDIFRKPTGMIPLINLPRIGEEIKILYISSFYQKAGHEKALKALISQSLNIAFENQYHLLTIGLHENNPTTKLLKGFTAYRLTSNLYLGSLTNNEEMQTVISDGIPFVDFSLI